MPHLKLALLVVVLILNWGMALKVPPAKPEASYLALGDSYTIGESVEPGERYPEQVRRLLAEKDHLVCGEPEIIAVTGWTTGNLLEALSTLRRGVEGGSKVGDGSEREGVGYDLISLLIGVNNQFQGRSREEYRQEFELLLQKSIRLAGNRPGHVVVLSIPDYSVTPFGRAGDTALIAGQIDAFNDINFALARKYAVHYVDVTGESRKAANDPLLVAADGLHFSGKEYGIWARLMEPVVKAALQ